MLQPLRGLWFCLGVCSAWFFKVLVAPWGWLGLALGVLVALMATRTRSARCAVGLGIVVQIVAGLFWVLVAPRPESESRVVAVVERTFPSGGARAKILWSEDSAWTGASVRLRAEQKGDTLAGLAKMSPPRKATVPGAFDERGWMATEGLDGRLSWGDSVVRTGGGNRSSASVSDRVRGFVRRVLAERLEPSSAALWTATLLAENDRVPQQALDAFRQSGLFHMLSVSGFHMAVLGGGTLVLLSLVRVPRRIAWLVAALVVIAYTALLGASAPISRSAAAFSLASLAWVSGRPVHSGNSFFLALGALVAVDPQVPFQMGAQLTFAATAALLWLSPALECMTIPVWLRGGRWHRWVLQPLLLSVSATLATAPILAWHTGLIPWIGIPAGLLGGAVFSIGFLAALATVAFSFLPTWAASGFSGAADGAARLIWELTLRSGQWQPGTISVGRPQWFTLGLTIVSLVALGLLVRPRLRWRVVAMMLAGWGIWAWMGGGRSPRAMEIVFLDVGQGNASLVTWPSGRVWLVDAGPASWKDPSRNAGAERILPYLRRMGVRHLDAVVVSHADLDHWGGLPALAAPLGPSRLLLSADSGTPGSPGFDSAVGNLEALGWSVERIGQGQNMTYGDGARCQVLGPARTDPIPRNRASLVLRFVFDSSSVVLAGDADSVSEAEILRSELPLAADVLLAGHHGSRHSSSLAWLRALHPQWTVLAYGPKNRYGHPNGQVIDRLDSVRSQAIHLPRESVVFRMNGHRTRPITTAEDPLWQGPWRWEVSWWAHGS